MNVYYFNLIFIIALLLPNMLLIFFPQPNSDKPLKTKKEEILERFERIGQIGVFILPIFFSVLYNFFLVLGLIISLLIYYICWIRFFINKREVYYLYSPLLFIPIPLAISPIVYYLFLSLLLDSYILFIFTIIFSIGHIPISYNSYKYYRNKHKKVSC